MTLFCDLRETCFIIVIWCSILLLSIGTANSQLSSIPGYGDGPCVKLPNEDNVEFWGLSKQQTTYQRVYTGNLSSINNFDVAQKVFIINHGHANKFSPSEPSWMDSVAQSLIKHTSGNVIIVNWGVYAFCDYISASIIYSPAVGKYEADLIRFLCNNGFEYDNIHVIGHSLGAHIAGLAGKRIKQGRRKIGTIIGLDPAGPLFSLGVLGTPYLSLQCNDAMRTKCLHTSQFYGTPNPCQDCDYYAYDGFCQPGCDCKNTSCSHNKAVEYFEASLDPINLNSFSAPMCTSLLEATGGECHGPIGTFGIYEPFIDGYYVIKPTNNTIVNNLINVNSTIN